MGIGLVNSLISSRSIQGKPFAFNDLSNSPRSICIDFTSQSWQQT